MLVRSKEGKFFEIDEETLKGKEVEPPPGAQPAPPQGQPQGGPMQLNIPGGAGGAPLIVINIAPPAAVGGPPSAEPPPSQEQAGQNKDAEGRQLYGHSYWHYNHYPHYWHYCRAYVHYF